MRERGAKRHAESSQHAGLHHIGAPENQGDGAEQIGQMVH